MKSPRVFRPADFGGLRAWFAQYLDWMCTSKNGKEEEIAKNNHGACWVAQAAAFAALTGNREVTALCRDRFKNNLLPDQLAPNGSFPLELARTKPYSYSLFDLDILAIICQIVSADANSPDNLWQFSLSDGRRYQEGRRLHVPLH